MEVFGDVVLRFYVPALFGALLDLAPVVSQVVAGGARRAEPGVRPSVGDLVVIKLRPAACHQSAQVTTAADSGSVFAGAAHSDEPWWIEPYPDALTEAVEPGPEARYDARESIALSFVAGLQHLPTQQRAALVLRDVLGFSAAEVAEMLDSTPASVNSALQRARAGLQPSSGPDRVTLPRSPHEAEVVDRFIDAIQQGDLDRVVALLTDDASLKMPPEPFEFHGPRAIAHFLQQVAFWRDDLKMVTTRANNDPAFGYYRRDPNADVYRASGIFVLTISEDQIASMTRFGDKSLFACFGLPRTIL